MIVQSYYYALGKLLVSTCCNGITRESVKESRQCTEQSFLVSVSHGFRHCPACLGDQKHWVSSFLWKKRRWSRIMTNSFAPSRTHIGPIFYMTCLPNIDTKRIFFRHTNQEKINFNQENVNLVQDLCLSWQHTLVRSGNSVGAAGLALQQTYTDI